MSLKMIYRGEPIKDISDLKQFRDKLDRCRARNIRERELKGYAYYLLNQLENVIIFAEKKS
jgi:hypothetical protein